MITRALCDEALPVYGDGRQVRDWIFVEDHIAALWQVCKHGDSADEVYNLGGQCEVANIDIVRELLRLLSKPTSLIQHVPDRPGHDIRYAMNVARSRDRRHWAPRKAFVDGLRERWNGT